MKKKIKMKKKTARAVQLNDKKPQDLNSIDNLKALSEVLPGCSDLTSAFRYVCEVEVPKITQKFRAMMSQSEAKASERMKYEGKGQPIKT